MIAPPWRRTARALWRDLTVPLALAAFCVGFIGVCVWLIPLVPAIVLIH